MNLKIKNLIILTALFLTGSVPCGAKINGGISSEHFYDLEKTIMPQRAAQASDFRLSTGKYWETNVFYLNKYRPIFLLSNNELYDFRPEKKAVVVNKLNIPSVYNVSFKTSSVKKVSFSQSSSKNVQTPQPKTVMASKNIDRKAIEMYESAKGNSVDSEKKIEAAMYLKNTKADSNYFLAIDLLEDVTRKEPYNAYAYYIKGELFALRGDVQNALKNYVEALKINPYSKQSCLGIAKILEPTNRILAQKYYDKAK